MGKKKLKQAAGGISVGSSFKDITDSVGLTDHEGTKNANEESRRQSDLAESVAKEERDFQRAQYNDWKDVYGGIQDQLNDYYSKLDGTDAVSQQLAKTSSEFQAANKQVTQQLAQRGIASGGLEAAALTSLAGQEAGQRASIRSSQDRIAAQERMQFLGLGLGQGTAMLGTQAGLAGQTIASHTALSGQQTALQGQLSTAGMGSMSSLVNTSIDATGQALGGAAAGSDIRFKNDIKLVKSIGNYNIYSWFWNNLGNKIAKQTGKAQGVLAQEMLYVNPKVVEEVDGYYYIKLDKLPKEIVEEIDYE